MKAKANKLTVSKNEVNNVWKEEQKSFEFCAKALAGMNDTKVTKYLVERGLSKTYLTEKNEKKALKCKDELLSYSHTATFYSASGEPYTALCRKNREGEIVEAKWSIWALLCAIDKKYKAESVKKGVEEMKAKEASIKAIEAEEKKSANKPVSASQLKAGEQKKQGTAKRNGKKAA